MRFRKDLGDLTELKKSIKKHGLIHPVVVDSKGNLIAGERRRAACRELGFEPEVRVVDFDNPQQAEIDENTCRKDFTLREIYEIGQYYKENYSQQGKRNGSNGNGDFVQNPNKVKKPIEITAKVTGKSVDTISKLNQIFESKYESIKLDLDLGKTSINEAYERVKRKERQETERMRAEARQADFLKSFADPERARERAEEAKRFEEEAKRRAEETKHRVKKLKEKQATAREIINLGYKAKAKRVHPDVGGTSEEMHEIQELKQLLTKYVENNLIHDLKRNVRAF
jgi:tellurite resistance protein